MTQNKISFRMDVQLTYCLTPGIYRVEMAFTNGMIESIN